MKLKPYTLKAGGTMNIVIQQRKETKIPKGAVCREVKQRDDSPTFYGIGEPIAREPRYKYDIRLKDKGVQSHICTITYWDIVDGWANGIVYDSIERHLRLLLMKDNGFTKDHYWHDDVKAIWGEYTKTADYNSAYREIDRLVYIKLQPIIDRVNAEYATSEEGEIKVEQDAMKEQAIQQWEQQQKIKEHERAEYTKRSNEHARKDYEQFFSGGRSFNASPVNSVERDMVNELVQAGYKALTKKYHPDIGGNHETFILLGKVKDKLMGI